MSAWRDPDDLVRALTENSIWQVWSHSGDTKVDALFAIGVEQMNHGQSQAAIDTFTEIIRLKPDFAEGWNKRATVYFLIGEYDDSDGGCDPIFTIADGIAHNADLAAKTALFDVAGAMAADGMSSALAIPSCNM